MHLEAGMSAAALRGRSRSPRPEGEISTYRSPRKLVSRHSHPATFSIILHNRKDRYHDTQPPADATLRG